MITLENITIGYGSRILLDHLSLNFGQEGLTALLGRNGSGKSTLLRSLIGLKKTTAGTIRIQGKEITSIAPENLARLVSFVSTEKIRIPHLKCKDIVAMGRAPYTNWMGKLQPQDQQIVAQALTWIGMTSYADRYMHEMSDGECQRILIARALAQDTPIILLDEPTSFLDLPNRYELGVLLQKLAHEFHKCILFSTHELDIALSLCDSIALIDNPNLHYLPTEKMKTSGHIERLFQNSTITFDPNTQRVIMHEPLNQMRS